MPRREDLKRRDEQLAALRRLAGQVAHDFNNLLAPILGYSTLIKDEFPSDSAGLQFAKSLEASARRAESNIEQTLVATRPQRRFQPRQLQFDQLISEEVTRWKSSLPPTSGIKTVENYAPCTIIGDEFHWRTAIQNLLSNARYGCATGGTITIELVLLKLDAETVLDLGLPSDEVLRLTVADTGFGMPAEVLSNAFEPFYTSRPKGTGLGLGLTACHSITYLHGGQIDMESVPNGGTRVSVWLPLEFVFLSEPAPRPAGAAVKKSPTSFLKKRILLADDDPLVREVIKTALLRAGFEVLTAEDGQAAWKMFERFHKGLSLVLSDFSMPMIDGVQLTRQIKELNNDIPIYILSGDHSGELESKLKDYHLEVTIFHKPFALSELVETVKGL